MNTYFSALRDVSASSENPKLAKKLIKSFQKTLKIPASRINLKEHNAFIFVAADKSPEKSFDHTILEELQSTIHQRLQAYYGKNKSKFQKSLNSQRELKETSQIIRNFLKEIDPQLEKKFNLQLKKLISELPTQFYELQTRSLTAIWDIEEEHKVQLYLAGLTPSILQLSEVKPETSLEALVDKLAFLNFFCIFLDPTLSRLHEINNVLERLTQGLQGTHFLNINIKTQTKLEISLRILSAKLNSLQTMDKNIISILELFNEPQVFFNNPDFDTVTGDLQKAVQYVSGKIEQCKSLLIEVQSRLEECQVELKEYLDDTKNAVKSTNSQDESEPALLTMAEMSSDLFLEAEQIRLWMDFFSSDLPFYTFQSSLFTPQTPNASEASSEYLISVRSLVKNYSLGQTTVYALRGVNLDIREGEFVAIVGNSGAGKTTLLNCMAGFDEPDSGAVFFKGKNLHQLSDHEKSKARLLEMGFIFQSYALLPHFDARENVALPADLAGHSEDLKNRIEALLEGVGISKQATQYPAQLSGGQLQRVAIARALTNRPEVLFADEPTGDLDSKTGKQVMELIKRFHEETHTTIIIITHEQDIARYAKRQIIIEDGIVAS
jgi:putative ABC transport system ATP-binding protein